MRIAYVLNTYPAVSQTFIRREIQALEALGAQIHRFAARGWDSNLVDPQDMTERDCTHYLLRDGVRALLSAVARQAVARPARFARAVRETVRMTRQSERGLRYHLAYLAEACRLIELIRPLGIEHVHAHFGTNSTEMVLLARVLGGPTYSFTVHGPEEFDRPASLHLREKVEQSAFVVAISSFCRSQLYRWLPYPAWPKVQIVHCGLDQRYHTGGPPPPCPARRMVSVGRLCEQKGQMLLLQAASQLAARGVEFELVLAGDGELRPVLEAMVARQRLQKHVRITGWLSNEQVRAEVLAARALVLPSFAEGLPVVIMEAMALGRPVLTTAVAGIPELVEHGRHGWLVPAGDTDALAGAMEKLLDTPPETLARMGADARARVLSRHCIDESARRLIALFNGVRK